jgi:hypothetical protein
VLLYIGQILWILLAIPKLRRLGRPGIEPELATLGGALCAGLVVVMVAGTATDYLMAEVQFWLYAGLVCVFQFGRDSLLKQATVTALSRPKLATGRP